MLNEKWEIVLPPVYANAGNWGAETFVDGYCQVTKGNRFGYVNEAGEEAIPITYSTNNASMQKALFTILPPCLCYPRSDRPEVFGYLFLEQL